MTNEEFAILVESEGWEYILTRVNPDRLEDVALAEAVVDLQDAFRILANMLPDVEDIYDEYSDVEELDFG